MNYVQDPVNPTMGNSEQGLQVRGSSIVKSAQETYQLYCEAHIDPQQPLGVAVDRNTHRGQLIFAEQPVLLPHETFVSLSQIEMLATEAEPISSPAMEEPLSFTTDDLDVNDFMTDQYDAEPFHPET